MPYASPVNQVNASPPQNSSPSKPVKTKRFTTSQKVTIVAIILLILLISSSVICRYWSEISQAVVQLLFSLYVRAL
jgi:cell division protein FtsL